MFTDLIPSFRETSSWFDDVFADFNSFMKSPRFDFDSSFPPINLYMNSDDNACTFEFALTGYKKEWLNVEVDGTTLTIEANVPSAEEDESKKYLKRRIKAQSFKKMYKIPEGYAIDDAEVTYEDGLLVIEIPAERKPEPQVRKISIK